MALLLGVIVSSTLILALLLGPWVAGLNLCAAIHNYANDGESYLGILFNVLFELKRSDTFSFLNV